MLNTDPFPSRLYAQQSSHPCFIFLRAQAASFPLLRPSLSTLLFLSSPGLSWMPPLPLAQPGLGAVVRMGCGLLGGQLSWPPLLGQLRAQGRASTSWALLGPSTHSLVPFSTAPSHAQLVEGPGCASQGPPKSEYPPATPAELPFSPGSSGQVPTGGPRSASASSLYASPSLL